MSGDALWRDDQVDSMYYVYAPPRSGKRLSEVNYHTQAYGLGEKIIDTAFGQIKTWDHPTRFETLSNITTKKVTDSAILLNLPRAAPGYEWHYINTPVDLLHGDYAISKLGIAYPYDECLPLSDQAQASGVVAGSGVVYRLVKKAPYRAVLEGKVRFNCVKGCNGDTLSLSRIAAVPCYSLDGKRVRITVEEVQ